MSASIVFAVSQIKHTVAQLLTASAIEQVCRESGHDWRQRTLGPAETVWAFVWQNLDGNPWRPHRVQPCVVKRRSKPFKLMTAPRCQLQQQLYARRVGA